MAQANRRQRARHERGGQTGQPRSDFRLRGLHLGGEPLESRQMLTALDPNFGAGGFAHVHPGDPAAAVAAEGLAVENDGSILQAGQAVDPVSHQPVVALVHVKTDGTLDSLFGNGGVVLTPISTGTQTPIVKQLLLDQQGRILIAGGDGTNFEVFRYTSAGQPDVSFGTGGAVSTPLPGTHAQGAAERIAVDTLGRVVLAGGAMSDERGNFAAVLRLLDNGMPDVSFAANGLAVATGPGVKLTDVTSLVAEVDGSAVVGGNQGAAGTSWALLRFNSAGRMDGNFGLGGVVTTDFGGQAAETAFGISEQEDSKLIVVGGPAAGGSYDLARYNPDGSLDPTFGNAGKLSTSFPGAVVAHPSVVIDADQKILVAGGLSETGHAGGYFGLARYMTDGSLDSTFGAAGLISTFGAAQSDESPTAVALALDVDNNIVLGSSGADFNLARFQGDPQVPITPAIFIADQSIAAPSSGSQTLVFDVLLSAAAAQPVTVSYSTADDTARAGLQYTAVTGVLTFAAGQTDAKISVPILPQTAPAANESFVVRLSNAVGAPIENNQVSGTILSNQSFPTVSVDDHAVAADPMNPVNVVFLLTLSGPATAPVTVGYQTVNDTTHAGVDYASKSGTATFAPGVVQQLVTVAVRPNLFIEPDERFFLQLSNPQGASVGSGQSFTTIQNSATTSTSWRDPLNSLDVNGDGAVTALDALIVINFLNSTGPEVLPAPPAGVHFFYDVDGSKSVTPVDALMVINFLNGAQAAANVAVGLAAPAAAAAQLPAATVFVATAPQAGGAGAVSAAAAELRSEAALAPAASLQHGSTDWNPRTDVEDLLDLLLAD